MAFMKRGYLAILALLAVVLLFGCFGQPAGDLNLVPDKADSYVVIKPVAILSDPDLLSSIKDSTSEDFQGTATKVKEESGIDPYAITKITIFMNMERGSASNDQYGGIILVGQFDKQKIVSKVRENATVEEEQYGGITIYKVIGENSDTFSKISMNNQITSFAFANDNTALFGTLESVKDCVDVKNGNRQPLKDASLDRAVGAVDSGAMILAAVKIPSSVASSLSQSSGGPFDVKSFGKATYVALSYNKLGSVMSVKLSLLFQTETDAQKAKDVLDGAVSMARGLTKSGSASEKVLGDIRTSSNGDIVSLGLDVTTENWNKLQEELRSSSASGQTGTGSSGGTNGGQGTPSPTNPYGQDSTAPSPGIGQTGGDLVEFYGEECPHCQNMKPVVAQVEEETGVTFTKLEVWHNAENDKVFQSYSATISAKCGGLGVPTFYNLRTGEAICGETSKKALTAFVEADQGS